MTSPAGTASAGTGEGGQGTGSAAGPAQPSGGRTTGGQGGPEAGGGRQTTQATAGKAEASGSQNGLYAKYLEGIPTQLHPTVTEAFKAWDADVTRNQQEVRSQLTAYQPLIDAGADPAQLQVAHEFVGWLQEDPAEALRQMVSTFELDPQQVFGLAQAAGQQPAAAVPGQQPGEDEGHSAGQGDPQDGVPPWFAQFQEKTFGPMQQMVNLMAQGLVEQYQGQQAEAEIDQLEQLLQTKGVTMAEGDPQLGYVLGQLAMAEDDSVPIEQAVDAALESWNQLKTTMSGQAASAAAPQVLPAGGGLPTQQVDPASLSQKDRRALAVQSAMRHMAGGG